MKLIRRLLNLKQQTTIRIAARDLGQIRRYLARGFKLVFSGAWAYLTGWA